MSAPTLPQIMKEAFASGNREYSDMKIKDSDGSVYHVHKSVVCWQSPFFANAMKDGRFKESFDNSIALSEDEPKSVKSMLEYLYSGDYTADSDGILQLHIDVYVIADKYQINKTGLASLACRYMEEIYKSEATMKDFLVLLNEAETRTADSDRLLRPLLVRIAAKGFDNLIDQAGFREAAATWVDFGSSVLEEMRSETPGISDQLQKSAAEVGKQVKVCRCPNCKRSVLM